MQGRHQLSEAVVPSALHGPPLGQSKWGLSNSRYGPNEPNLGPYKVYFCKPKRAFEPLTL